MSGPKIINVEATRELERKRLASHAAGLRVALHRLEKATEELPEAIVRQVPQNLREQLTALEEKAATSRDVIEIMALRDQARSLHAFVRSEKRRILQAGEEWRAAETANLQSLDSWISHLRNQAEENETILAELSEIENSTLSFSEAAARLESISDQLSDQSGEQETEAEIDSIRELAEEWQKLVAQGEVHTSELPTLPMARWRVEVERLRQHSDAHPDMAPRIAAIEAEKDVNRRQMLLDDLRYTAADWLALERTRNEQEDRKAEWRESLLALGMNEKTIENQFEGSFEDVKQWAEESIESLVRAEAATFARRAILQAFDELGYEVREGMETAWIENGQIVVSKPDDSLYGVEITQMPQQIIKTRVVRKKGQPAATANDKQRDREEEESWCADREALEKELAKEGVELQIKAAREPGSVAVEVVESSSEVTRHQVAETRNNRTREK